MTKTLEQIQEENRKFILEAIHCCSYEEALKKELEFGCKVIDKKHRFFGESSPEEMTLIYGDGVDGEESDPLYFLHLRGDPFLNFSNKDIFNKDRFEIIGKPLTLSRVLLAIWKSDKYYYKSSFDKDQKEMWFDPEFHALKFGSGVSFDLTKETLEEQSEETQRKINELFTN